MRRSLSGRPDVGASLLLTLLIVSFHLIFLTSAGGFWRDETNSLNLASTATLAESWALGQFGAFPFFWVLLLRSWLFLTGSAADLSIRVFGLLVGVGIVAALWHMARSFGYSAPWVALVLFGFNATVIRFGDSLRGYGAGMLAFLLTYAAYWRFCRLGGKGRLLLAIFFALISVHLVFYNSVYVLSVTVGSLCLLVRRSRWRDALWLFAGGLLCALSLLPYGSAIRQTEGTWNHLVQFDVDAAWLWLKLQDALAGAGPAAASIWISVVVLSLLVCVTAAFRREGSSVDEPARELFLFSGMTLLVGVVGHALFLWILSYVMQPWYFVTGMCLVAACTDTILMTAIGSIRMRHAHILVGILALVTGASAVYAGVSTRQTNVDLIARRLSRAAHPGDLIVVYPWQAGITFRRYYSGPAEWMTLPPIADLRVHRYDLFQTQLDSPGAIAPILRKTAECLSRGSRIWLVSSERVPRSPDDAMPAAGGTWLQRREQSWLQELGARLQAGTEQCGRVAAGPRVSRFEALFLECRVGSRGGGVKQPEPQGGQTHSPTKLGSQLLFTLQ